ncbi:hypothetical protein LCGC14_2686580 [marine sediment metagenome]|uniref:Ribose-5-phosphate isomerase n=1 Tax=marine sediment metagenome TaxID=412755 RepID=A0A0F9CBH1_9ZZZZ
MKIAVGNDHRGFEAKQRIKAIISQLGHECIDFGSADSNPVDYPDPAYSAAMAVSTDSNRPLFTCVCAQANTRRD